MGATGVTHHLSFKKCTLMVTVRPVVPAVIAVAVLGAAGCSSDDTAVTSDHSMSSHASVGADATSTADAAGSDAAELDAAAVCKKIVELNVGLIAQSPSR